MVIVEILMFLILEENASKLSSLSMMFAGGFWWLVPHSLCSHFSQTGLLVNILLKAYWYHTGIITLASILSVVVLSTDYIFSFLSCNPPPSLKGPLCLFYYPSLKAPFIFHLLQKDFSDTWLSEAP